MSHNSIHISPKKKAAFDKLKKKAGHLLWEYDLKKLSDSEAGELLMERVMQFGDMNQIRSMMQVYSFSDLAVYFESEGWKQFSNINFNFWHFVLKDYKKKEIDWNKLLHQRQSIRNRFIAWKH